ncbi:hypothetical protein ACVBGC_19200 [Burkholderia stagnalis]
MDINDVLAVVNTEAAAALCLSKGGWEGWMQCELWRYLSINRQEAVEREVAYPGGRERCDLVASAGGVPLWVEIKCYGIFREGDGDRFLDAIAKDLSKLDMKPPGARGLALVVVPKAIADSFDGALRARRWLGFQTTESLYARVYHLTI